MQKKPLSALGYDFIPHQYLAKGEDEYHLRFQQNPQTHYRSLTSFEIETLIKNKNHSTNWSQIFVSDGFDPALVFECHFYGLIRIGKLESVALLFHDIYYPVGLYNSHIYSCDIGDNNAIQNVNHMARYITGDEVILQNIGEMSVSNHAKFGVGAVKDGEDEDVRIWLEIANENGNRRILPFLSLHTADAWLWSTYKGDDELQQALVRMTEKDADSRRGYYGVIANNAVIKESHVIKDVNVGEYAYIKGTNKLKNLTIKSKADATTQIGEGVELVNGIVGYGCHIFYGVKAVRFVMQDHSNLKYGARLINSVLGSNSTISCCEVLNSLIFAGHEQHHNSSFLCAARLMGQSNIASNVTAGSNHNSRSNDGELIANRGFWPGLSSSFKLPSRFASFSLIPKGSYPSELNLHIPFALLANSENDNTLILYPAFWFLQNMYALARNSWKYKARDKRLEPRLNFEYNYLAPDTINEIIDAQHALRRWTKTSLKFTSDDEALQCLLTEDNPAILADDIEVSNRSCHVYKAGIAYRTYSRILRYYIATTLANYYEENHDTFIFVQNKKEVPQRKQWVNYGSLLIEEHELTSLITAIKSDSLTWDKVHGRYQTLSQAYAFAKCTHAFACYHEILSHDEKATGSWLAETINTASWLDEQVYLSRKKDYDNQEKLMTFQSEAERDAVLGKLDENSFIQEHSQATQKTIAQIKNFKDKVSSL